ncbi:MAG TPA: AI-2E family transporter [Candidatus Saccharimonadales bacterium]|nr:AI-2E family transporter [Candidatus Saccharimonadales bacterium]
MFSLLHRTRNKETIELTVSTRTVVRILLLIFAFLVGVLAVRKASHALLLIFISFFLTLALNAPVHKVASWLPGSKKGSRPLATTLSFLLVAVLLAAFIASLVPPLVSQTQKFINAAPHLVSDLQSENNSVGRLVHRYHLESQVQTISTQLGDRLKHASGAAVSTIARVGSSAFAVLTILALTFMMLVEGPRWVAFGKELLPDHMHKDAERLSTQMYGVVKGYVNGQVALAALAALMISPALFILHVSYPAALIVVIFICGLIPMVGHTIGAIIVTLVALLHSPPAAITILIYYILYQQVENYLIQPRLQANTTNMSPLMVFVSVVIGVSFGGLVGGLVAIPVAGCVKILILDYLRSREIIEGKTPHDSGVAAELATANVPETK